MDQRKVPLLLCSLVLCLSLCQAYNATYKLVDDYSGQDFFNGWTFFTGGDPTHGYVDYVGQAEANQKGYTQVQNGVVFIRSDSTSVASGAGRNSIRLTSKKSYSKGSLFIWDVKHMPAGCGNWPALWTVGPNWPYSGEIDVVEGVNNNNRNQMTLHTGPGCTMPANWNESGKQLTTDCNSANGANGNAGCGVQSNSAASFGAPFNNNGGGVFTMQWAESGIYIWFFPRNNIPADITNNNPDTGKWGTPAASFPFQGTGPGSCPSNKFANQQLVIDNTFCGDWAGAVFSQDGCSGSCNTFVQNNPNAFKEAFWAIESIKVYE